MKNFFFFFKLFFLSMSLVFRLMVGNNADIFFVLITHLHRMSLNYSNIYFYIYEIVWLKFRKYIYMHIS